MTPVVAKSLAIGIGLLYITGMTTLLLGGVVPEYRSGAGDELGDRVLATAGGSIEQSASEANGSLERTETVELPPSIRSSSYELELDGEWLTLSHPDPAIGGTVRLSLPPAVTVEQSSWSSGRELEIRVRGPETNRTLTLDESTD